jgi:protein NrfC
MPEGKKELKEKASEKKKYSRRDFLAISGTVVAADLLMTAAPGIKGAPAEAEEISYPASIGYLVYDSKKCIGCTTCMLSCSTVHYGEQSLSLARIQIIQDSWGKFPEDLQVAPCRQCVTPPCVINCPVNAAHVDTKNGNIRRIDEEKCIGCGICLQMCPQQPHRTVWNHIKGKSSKCDLCIDTPFWNEKGGIGGKQACVESCPVKAIRFVQETPDQTERDGYDVNLRNKHWYNLGLVDDSRIVPPIMKNRSGSGAQPEPDF